MCPADFSVGVCLVDPVRVDEDMCKRLALFDVMIGHKRDETDVVCVGEGITAVGSGITGDNSFRARELLLDCADNRWLDLMSEVIVGDMKIGREADHVETGIKDHASADTVGVEVWYDGDLFVRGS